MAGKAQVKITFDMLSDLSYAPYACLFNFKGEGKFDPIYETVTYDIESELLPEGDNGLVRFFIERKQTIDTVSWTIRFEPVA